MTANVFGDFEAEAAVLATVLCNGVEFPTLELHLGDFYDPRHRLVFEAMSNLAANGRPPSDMLELRRVVGDRVAQFGTGGDRSEAGFYGFLSELGDHATFGNVPVYVERVRRATMRRSVIVGLSEVVDMAKRGDADGPELLECAWSALSRIAEGKFDDPTVELGSLAANLYKAKSHEVEAFNRGDRLSRLATGITEVDEIIGGVPLHKLTILAGGTSHGKSSLARSIALNIHAAGEGVHVFSLEDDRDSFAERTLSDIARVKLWTLANAPERLDRTEWARLIDATDRLYQAKGFLVDDTAALSVGKIALRLRKHKRTNRTRLVVVDYLQQIREPGIRPGPGSRKLHVDAAVDGLVELARSEEVAVLALCQLSRENAREGRAPELYDLRESGEIEQQAHTVVAVYRPEKDAKSPGQAHDLRGKAFVRVLKNKKGGVGDVEMFFDAERATYTTRRLELVP